MAIRVKVVTAKGEYNTTWNSLNDFIRLYQIGGVMKFYCGERGPSTPRDEVVHVPWGAVLEVYEY